ncbi:hypothetical protein B0H10DRAFT_1948481 [Mycena sp. CBHHK59/15]|nr:hypothetical protein B0H10DRAFT_1948481 [Mycena sp. CBHHK59/15]
MTTPDLNTTYGAMLIGGGAFIFILCDLVKVISRVCVVKNHAAPVEIWMLNFRRMLDLAHMVLICQSAYHYLVDNWGNEAALLESTAELDLHLVLLSLATILCQGFFVHRMLGTVILDNVMSAQTIRNKSIATIHSVTGEVISVFALGAAAWKDHLYSSNFIVTRIIQYTVEQGLPKSWASLIAAMHFSLGRMYMNALLATLQPTTEEYPMAGVGDKSRKEQPNQSQWDAVFAPVIDHFFARPRGQNAAQHVSNPARRAAQPEEVKQKDNHLLTTSSSSRVPEMNTHGLRKLKGRVPSPEPSEE